MRARGVLAIGLLALAGCGGSTGSTGATCPSSSTLTYASFGQGFMNSYCVRCHGAERAEDGLRLDTQVSIKANASAIDREAGAFGSVVNADMPEDGAMPTTEERKQLSEWLACGAN